MSSRVQKVRLLILLLLVLVLQTGGERTHEAIRPLAAYWAQTGIRPEFLEGWINNLSCRANLRTSLACINSLEALGRWRGLTLNGSGHWVERSAAEDLLRTEKRLMSNWRSRLLQKSINLNFDRLFKQVLSDQGIGRPVRPADQALMAGLALNAYFSIVEDPHTYFIPRNFYEEVLARYSTLSRNYGMVTRLRAGRLVLHKVHEGSSAQRAGLRRGDEILSVNQVPIEDFFPHEIQNMAVTFSFNDVRLEVRRGSTIESIQLEAEVDQIQSSEVKRLSQGLGLLTLHRFTQNLCAVVRRQVQELKEQGLRGLLIDLRDNPGGYMDEALCIAGLFVPKGTLLLESRYLNPRDGRDRSYSKNSKVLYDGPLAVLINSGTASASEILAGTLRETRNAVLVGERTFGKGTFQDGDIVEGNDQLLRFQTQGVYYFPSGWSPQLIGIEPDIVVEGEVGESPREFDLYFATIAPSRQIAKNTRRKLTSGADCGQRLTAPLDKQLRIAGCQMPANGAVSGTN